MSTVACIGTGTVGRAWADARVGRIYGGSSEVMREIIARTL